MSALFALAAGVSLGLLIIGYVGSVHPAMDSFAHFRLHFAAAAALFGIAAVFIGWRKLGLATCLAGLAGLASTGQWIIAHPAKSERDYSLFHMNIRFDNPTPQKVLSMIGSASPDIITLNEVSTYWQPYFQRIEAIYPHRIICQRDSVIGGVAILSRRPFVDPGRCLHDGMVAVQKIDINGSVISVVAVHLHWPWPFGQPQQIRSIVVDLVKLDSPNLIIAGDFNATPWSSAIAMFEKTTGAKSLQGIGATWLPGLAQSWAPKDAGLPIDQVLIGQNFKGSARRLGDRAGSDHLPVLARFSITGTYRPDS